MCWKACRLSRCLIWACVWARAAVLVVCHGGVMRVLLAQARGMPREQLLQVPVIHGALFGLQVGPDGELAEVDQ